MARNHCRGVRSCILVAAAAWTFSCPAAAEIYASEAPDGSFRYSSQRLDSTYKLLISDRPQPRDGAATKKASRREQQLDAIIERAAQKHELPAPILRALIGIESGFNADAVSPKGARGPMQLMPHTAMRYGISDPRELHHPERSIDAGARHLKDLLQKHQGNVALALAAYNAGSGAVARHSGRIPPYTETMLYVPAVLSRAASEALP